LRIWACGLRNSQVVLEFVFVFSIRNREPARRVGVRRTNPRSPIRNVMTPVDCRKRGKSIEVPSGGSPKPGPLGPDSLLLTFRRFPAAGCRGLQKSRASLVSKLVRKVARCVLARKKPRKTPNPFAMMSPWENVRNSLNV
jgi:hypothetical protein